MFETALTRSGLMLQNEVNEICLLCADNAFSFNEEFELMEKRGEKEWRTKSTGRRKFKCNEISVEWKFFLFCFFF